jgi:hypothetical protein
MKTLGRYLISMVVTAGLVALSTTSPARAAKSKPSFSLFPSARNVSVSAGQSASVRINVKQSKGSTIPVSFATSTSLRKVAVSKSDVSPSGVTLTVTAQPDSPKQKGFVDVIAKSAGKTKRLRIPVVVPPAGSPVANIPTTVAAVPQTPVAPTSAPTLPSTVGRTVPASAPGSNTASTTLPVPATVATTVAAPTKPTPDFSLEVGYDTDRAYLVALGQSYAGVSIRRTGGYVGSPKYSVEGLPPQITAVTAPFVLVDPSDVSISISATASATVGVYSGIVVATDGAMKRTAPLTVEVKPAGKLTLTVGATPQYLAPNFTTTVRVALNLGEGLRGPVLLNYEISGVGLSGAGTPIAIGSAETFDLPFSVATTGLTSTNVNVRITATSQADGAALGTVGFSTFVSTFVGAQPTSITTVASRGKTAADTTVTDNSKFVTFTQNEIVGLTVTYSCATNVVGLLVNVTGGAGEYRVNVSMQLLAFGTYQVRCVPSVMPNRSIEVTVIAAPFGSGI